MHMKRGNHFVTHGSFVFKEERAVSRNELAFNDMCVSECQGTWHTYDAVTDEAQKEV